MSDKIVLKTPVVKTLKVSFGVSIDAGMNHWVKANTEMELELDGRETIEQRQEIWDNAWLKVQKEVNEVIEPYKK